MPKSKSKDASQLPPSGKHKKQAGGKQSPGGGSGTQNVDIRPLDLLSPTLLSEESRAQLREQYSTSQPYTHCVMRDLFNPEALARCRDEIINNIQATYKETDLFKVFQTGDLGNLDKLDKEAAAKLPTLMALKAALYSPEFRSFVREITGCGELADKTDTSCNIYAQGGHLLCHDDVIGTRRVSWIIYLTDPERPWTKEDGGALELYPLEKGQQHTPTVHPTLNHLPTFNTMAMFTVLPGKSFHAVQEVLAEDKPRMSISGWYHAPHEPEDKDKASLQQLQAANPLTAGQDNSTAEQFEPFISAGAGPSTTTQEAQPEQPQEEGQETLSEEDLAYLIRYINPAYLSETAWPKIQAKFREDGSVQLQRFLSKGYADKVLKALKAADSVERLGGNALPEYEAGVHCGWEAVGPPHKQRFLRYAADSSEGRAAANGVNGAAAGEEECKTVGQLLATVRDTVFRSAPFQRLLRCFTTLTMVGQRGEVRRFRPGLDYTVAHYGILTQDPRLDVVLCFVDEARGGQSQENAEQKGTETVWNDGEVGGYEAYLLADEDKEGAAAAEVYRQDADESGVLNVEAAFNSLNLVLRDEGLMKFVKYVSASAPGSRWDIAMEYLPEEDSSDEEEEEEEQDQREAAKQEAVKHEGVEETATELVKGRRGKKGQEAGGSAEKRQSGGKRKESGKAEPDGSGSAGSSKKRKA